MYFSDSGIQADLSGCQLNPNLTLRIKAAGMKRMIISMAMFLSLMVCQAQERGKGTLEIAAGPSFPMGEFSYTQSTFEGSGYAGPGLSLALSFHYRVKPQLGLAAIVSENFLRVDEASVARKYWQPEFGYDWFVEAEPWRVGACLGGIDVILPLVRSDFYFQLLGGFSFTRLPELTGTTSSFRREASSDIAAAWGVGTGLNYQDFEKVTLSLGLEIFVTNPVLAESWSFDVLTGHGKIFQNIVLVNLKASLGLRLFR
jgi:hypothetical protein